MRESSAKESNTERLVCEDEMAKEKEVMAQEAGGNQDAMG